jgi:hypothetical protein
MAGLPKMEAPASKTASVSISQVTNEAGANYILSYQEEGKEPRALWRTSIENNPEHLEEGCNLLSADENGRELAVLMESDQFNLRLLRINPLDGKLIADQKIMASALLQRIPFEGGILQIKVPDRIEWKNSAGLTRNFTVVEDKLRTDGDVGFEPSSFDAGFPREPAGESTEQPAETSSNATGKASGPASDAASGTRQHGSESDQDQEQDSATKQ